MTLGERIKIKRNELNVSQKDLADFLGVNFTFICKVEKNEKIISLEKLNAICEILKLEYEEMKILFYSDKININ